AGSSSLTVNHEAALPGVQVVLAATYRGEGDPLTPFVQNLSVGQVDDNSFTAKPAVSRPQDALWQPLVQRDNRTKDLLFGTPYRKEVKEAFPVPKVSRPSVSLDYETDLSVFEEALQDVPATMVPSASLGDETLHDTVGSQERILDRIFSDE